MHRNFSRFAWFGVSCAIFAYTAVVGHAGAADIVLAKTARTTVISQATNMQANDVIDWWERADKACKADKTGGIVQACLDRTDLAFVLEHRGYCESIINGGKWHQCVVGGAGGGTGASSSGYVVSPEVLRATRGGYNVGTSAGDRQSVSPAE